MAGYGVEMSDVTPRLVEKDGDRSCSPMSYTPEEEIRESKLILPMGYARSELGLQDWHQTWLLPLRLQP